MKIEMEAVLTGWFAWNPDPEPEPFPDPPSHRSSGILRSDLEFRVVGPTQGDAPLSVHSVRTKGPPVEEQEALQLLDFDARYRITIERIDTPPDDE